jgi:hypothetical protein
VTDEGTRHDEGISASTSAARESAAPPATRSGPGRILIAVYALFAVAATGRSTVQLSLKASDAPVPYTLSLLAALIYATATVALFRGGRLWRRVAWCACATELVGVLVVGTISVLVDFPDATVWSDYGIGYGRSPGPAGLRAVVAQAHRRSGRELLTSVLPVLPSRATTAMHPARCPLACAP